MSKEKKSYLKLKIEDNMAQLFEKTEISGEEYSSSNTIFDRDISMEHSLLLMITNVINQDLVDDHCEVHWDIIKLLGKFLGIQNYDINLFSYWILKTLIEYIIHFYKKIKEYDYKIFIYWLYEEINIVCNNPDLTREQFFHTMKSIFHEVLTDILDGNAIEHPLKFTYKYFENEEEMRIPSIITLTGCDNKKSSSIGDSEEMVSNASQILNEGKNSYYENLLDIVIEATYKMFGSEVNYVLIQSAFNNQENISYYTIPYHFRKPRILKGFSLVKNVIPTNSKLAKTSEKRSVQTNYVDETRQSKVPIELFTNFNLTNLILPLSEALESYDVINFNENDEIEEGTSELHKVVSI